ncbi:unnamed protein product [Microthlaspi erraticum]|uniref:Knottin scorpion toxin-like domain-containing protein n=1 Tax=Microthlaspi erraticum TaxID=1685480 RepID=A0A6D2JQQ0_9BRAS|nr:unnamed protein product [Microthlaspi erraticum]
MAIATKSVSTFTIFFILFMVLIEVPEMQAQDSDCLQEYGGDVGFSFCAPRIYPTICHTRCVYSKRAKRGICEWNPSGGVTCLCDFCDSSVTVSDSNGRQAV